MNLEEYARERLWSILVDTVHALTMYPYHKAYTRDNILNGKPDITPEDLALRLGMPLGEAVVILLELGVEKNKLNERSASALKESVLFHSMTRMFKV